MNKFQLLCTVGSGEVHSMIDGKYYIHFIDSAFIPRFNKMYLKAPGKALNWLKEKSWAYEVDGKRILIENDVA